MSKWLSRLSHRTKQLGWKGAAKVGVPVVGVVPSFFSPPHRSSPSPPWPPSALQTIIYNNILRTGELVGVDRMGNHYYEAKDAQNGRQRWVEGTHYYFDASEGTVGRRGEGEEGAPARLALTPCFLLCSGSRVAPLAALRR